MKNRAEMILKCQLLSIDKFNILMFSTANTFVISANLPALFSIKTTHC